MKTKAWHFFYFENLRGVDEKILRQAGRGDRWTIMIADKREEWMAPIVSDADKFESAHEPMRGDAR